MNAFLASWLCMFMYVVYNFECASIFQALNGNISSCKISQISISSWYIAILILIPIDLILEVVFLMQFQEYSQIERKFGAVQRFKYENRLFLRIILKQAL